MCSNQIKGFRVGDKIRARRNNGILIEGEIDNLFENQASVFWHESGHLYTKKIKYDFIENIKPTNITQNVQQPITVNQPVIVSQAVTLNQLVDANKAFVHRNILKKAANMIFLLLITIFVAAIGLIFFSGVFEEYQRSHQVFSKS